MTSYSWPSNDSILVYPTFASFPPSATNGTLALDLSSDILYVYSTNSNSWIAIAGPGNILGIGTIDSTAASANGAVISFDSLIMQSASITVPGLVNNASQSFSGQKTFSTGLTGTLTGSASLNVLTSSLGNLTDLGTDGILVTGGTGAVVGSVVLSQHVADTTHNGYLSSTDWNTFNAKGSGTVTSVSIVSANGLAGSVATATTTPAITLSTSVTGILQGNGTAISAASTSGSGSVVLATSPTLVTPALGTPTALVGTNITGTAAGLTAGTVTTNANLTGPITSVGNVTSVAAQTGTGSVFVMQASPTLTTPNLGTPSALVGTNITGTASGFTAGSVTTNANLTGVITSSGNATSIASQTGTGTKFVVDTSPTIITPIFTTSATSPLIIGGSTASSSLTLESTSGVGTTDSIIFKVNSQSTAMTIISGGSVGIGTTSPNRLFSLKGSSPDIQLFNSATSGSGGVIESIDSGSAETAYLSLGKSFNLAGTGDVALVNTTASGSLLLGTNSIAALTITSAQKATFSGQLIGKGTATNDNASASQIGEYISSVVAQGSPVTYSGSGYNTITSIALTAGDWDISCIGAFVAGPTAGAFEVVISTAGNAATGGNLGDNYVSFSTSSSTFTSTAQQDSTLSIPEWRTSLAGSQTYFMTFRVLNLTAGTAKAYGRISARRRR